MGFFSKKMEISTNKYCTEFYDQYIFAPKIRGIDLWDTYCQTCYKTVAAVDPQFQSVDISTFTSELRALYLELFGTAFCHTSNERFAPIQSEFTKQYLEANNLIAVWEQMVNYNKAVARSITGRMDPNSRVGRAQLVSMNLKRADLFDKWLEMGHDPESIARAANRADSIQALKSRRLYIYLSFELTNRLGCEINKEARERLIAIIRGLYDGAIQSLQSIKIV
jgi:hypothetical protein